MAKKLAPPGPQDQKWCFGCEKHLATDQFSIARANPDGLASRCRLCQREYHLIKKFGLTLTDYDTLLQNQDYRCALCQSDDPKHGRYFYVDHDHVTGRIRGLLCYPCNSALAQLGDGPEGIKRVLAYVEGR